MRVVFSKEQFEYVERSEYDRFIDEFAREAAESWPQRRDAFPTWQAWRTEIVRLTDIARRDGLEIQREVRAHAAVTLEKGERFWEQGNVREILERDHLSTPTLKLFAVLHQLETGQLW